MQARNDRDEPAIDWSLPITPPRWMPRRAYITAVSQLYHGEVATFTMCHNLRGLLSDAATQQFLDTQIADEARHIDLYRRYLERLGKIGPAEPTLEAALDGRFVWPGSPLGTIVAVHVLLEGEGLRVQREFGHWFPCRLLRSINANISPDEARHIAFGRRTLTAKLETLTQDERVEIYRWLEALWRECAVAASNDLPGLIRLSMGRRWINERWDRHRRVLVQTGLVSEDEVRLAA